MTIYYSLHPSQCLKGNWLEEAGFDTEMGINRKPPKGANPWILIALKLNLKSFCRI
ncbi:hypothetical protein EXB72_22000 [Salmonella enterica subsp. enterica serovar Durham]|nr:hypothetical protein [Salmonella enterica subsp. enterica serovar Durham]EBM5748413.1 hypothetical protein [Salmonella enterica]ECC3298710.1 hypothetical protein [Salmonella enterica subsp. enterica]ECD0764670.1 hypothetical protein [Salmonella enterica subsp. enterica serovar Jukestown]ECF5807434.1 type I toxin-antitoxin system SymE family toxin [Salmonella enterica subsp. enterica serovar Bahati]